MHFALVDLFVNGMLLRAIHVFHGILCYGLRFIIKTVENIDNIASFSLLVLERFTSHYLMLPSSAVRSHQILVIIQTGQNI